MSSLFYNTKLGTTPSDLTHSQPVQQDLTYALSTQQTVRVRFAPSPTGFMHLGNVRAALFNFLFARQNKGTFILRIEDTDQQRNISPQTIFDDLAWLGLTYDEGPGIGGPHKPYFQSERSPLYQEFLTKLSAKKLIYRCFCTVEELEKKRLRQMALRHPPRYDRTCLSLDERTIEENIVNKVPCIWRLKLDPLSITIHDMARGPIVYDLNHFSDFALTRADGTFTFIFANCVDDIVMRITHVIRGEDHLSNTANQAALYHAFDKPLPIFWHLPILCNSQGKKLSKRDFGFSLNDLHNAGFLPEAICNYLATIGGSFEHELMSLEQLIKVFDFTTVTSTGHVRYDIKKLEWLNRQWIMKLDLDELVKRCHDSADFKAVASHYSDEELKRILHHTRMNIRTLSANDIGISFYFGLSQENEKAVQEIAAIDYKEYQPIIKKLVQELNVEQPVDATLLSKQLTALCKEQGLPVKNLFACIRLALTGQTEGYSITDLINLLGRQEVIKRLQILL